MTLKRLLLAMVFLGSGTASAGELPQMLSAIGGDQARAFQCAGTVCTAEIATFCLQKERPSPAPDTQYRAHDAGAFTLTVRDAYGVRHTVAAPRLAFKTGRGFTSVIVTATVVGLAERALTPVALTVGDGALLVPADEEDDAEPRRVAADLLPIASRVFTGHASKIGTVKRLAGALDTTRGGGAAADWEKARKAAAGDPRAEGIVGYCRNVSSKPGDADIRGCLARRMDDILMDINETYWKAATPGS